MLELYKKLISSKIFKDWKSRNKDSFLCSFVLIDNPQFDFYNKNDTMTSFIIDKEIEINEDEEIFNKSKLLPLDIENIKSTKEEILKIVKQKYQDEKFIKRILILQNPKEPVWNITLITKSLKLLNMQIDMNKKILSERFEPLTNFMKRVK